MRQIHAGSPNREFINRLSIMVFLTTAAYLLRERSLTKNHDPKPKRECHGSLQMYLFSFHRRFRYMFTFCTFYGVSRRLRALRQDKILMRHDMYAVF